jgi:hypothetical protein
LTLSIFSVNAPAQNYGDSLLNSKPADAAAFIKASDWKSTE